MSEKLEVGAAGRASSPPARSPL